MRASTIDSSSGIVFVADDLGICAGTNEGIDRLAGQKRCTSASLAVTGRRVEEGVRIAKAHALEVGLHLDLTSGTALTGPIRGLTDARGRFLGLTRLLHAILTHRTDRDRIAGEIHAQLARVIALGLAPAGHLDGHRHVHVLPVVRDALLDVIDDALHVRVPEETMMDRRRAACWTLGALARSFSRLWIARRPSARRALPFTGLRAYDAPDYGVQFEARLAAWDRKPLEWMIHPRVEDPAYAAFDRAPPPRHTDRELAFLLSDRCGEMLSVHGVRIDRFPAAHREDSGAKFLR